MCDHFASNPSKTGWTSTGGEKSILKTPRAISWRDWTGNFRQDLQNYQDSEDIGAGVLRFATVAYPGYTIVFPYWSKRYRAGV